MLQQLKSNTQVRKLVFLWRHILDKYNYTFGNDNVVQIKGVRINNRVHVKGNRNTIEASKGSVLKNSLLHINGNNNRIIIKDRAIVSGAELWIEDNNCLIEIGDSTFVGRNSHIACTEDNSQITIGERSMLSSNVQIRSGDSHSILDNEGNRINPAASVYIGEHCWLGEGCKVMKGVTIGKDTIISTGAIVTKSYAGGCCLEVIQVRF